MAEAGRSAEIIMYRFRFPSDVIEAARPLQEFKQDGAIVSVDLKDGRTIHSILLVSPDFIAAIPDQTTLTFDPSDVTRIYQTEADLMTRSRSDWTFFTEQN